MKRQGILSTVLELTVRLLVHAPVVGVRVAELVGGAVLVLRHT
jgi:hypothetical protein